mmetsp:Transcript_29068/g.50247  ORF Transcript_29068/g.50247 Transcript_29068/m.50247 type:complete len:104 (+) Transcript_29068:535-846(+)
MQQPFTILQTSTTTNKREKKTIQNYEKAIEIDPEHFDAWYNIGVVHHENGDLEKALECFERSAQIKPELEDARAHCVALRSYLEKKQAKEENTVPVEDPPATF